MTSMLEVLRKCCRRGFSDMTSMLESYATVLEEA